MTDRRSSQQRSKYGTAQVRIYPSREALGAAAAADAAEDHHA